MTLLYPYPYQSKALFIGAIIFIVIGFTAYSIYMLKPVEREQSEMNIRVVVPEMELTLLKLTYTY